MDREADFYELFDEQRRSRGVELLVRASMTARPRGDHLFDAVRHSPFKARFASMCRGKAHARRRASRRRARARQRIAQVTCAIAKLSSALRRTTQGRKPSSCGWCMFWKRHRRPMPNPLSGSCSDLPITTARRPRSVCVGMPALAHRRLASRPQKRLPHRTLQHKTAERLKRAIAINLVIAWRIMLMTLLGRECPTFPPRYCSRTRDRSAAGLRKKNESPSPLASAMPSVL